ncbi:alpha/beta hydrolase domain-containing protein [Xylariaceae sp. FL1272]|nr:alpha/beta hydrolase domain-containing protein [Xylariaceae sp. FL1272]
MSQPAPCPFDNELGALLAAAPKEFTATLKDETLPALAAAYSAPIDIQKDFIKDRPLESTDYTIKGHQDDDILISIIRRKDHNPQNGPPAFYYMHGGGMVMGHRMLGADFLILYVEEFGAVLAAVDYRVAPKHPYPTPMEDAYKGLEWLVSQSKTLGFDSARIMTVGTSAGAGIAAGLGLLVRDRRPHSPTVAWQLLASPMLDDRNLSFSSRQYEHHGVWNAHSNQVGWRAYLGDRIAGPDVPIYAAPARALPSAGGPGLAGLPPTLIDVGSAEVFRDEAIDFANGIWAVGGVADLHVWAGGFHGFDLWGYPRLTREALAARRNWVRRMLEWKQGAGKFSAEW